MFWLMRLIVLARAGGGMDEFEILKKYFSSSLSLSLSLSLTADKTYWYNIQRGECQLVPLRFQH